MSNQEQWDSLILPKNKIFDLKLKELWDYRDLIAIFVKRDIIALYKQTILGPLWYFLAPLMTVIVYNFVFNSIAKVPTDGLPGPLFYIAGTTLWGYFQTSFVGTSTTFISNKGIFGKVYFPRLVSPISLMISSLFKFFMQMLMFLGFWGYYMYKTPELINPNIYILLFPVILLVMAIMSLGLGLIISSLTTKYRDLTIFVGFGVSLIMYASPVVYPVSAIPAMYKPFLAINPIAPLIEAFRYGFTGVGSFSLEGLLYSIGFSSVTLFIGMVLFNRTEKSFMDTV